MDDMQRLLIEKQCESLSVRFANYVDLGMAEAVSELFSSDGKFSRAGQSLDGPEQVKAFLSQRPASRVTRHICTNISVDVISANEARGITYFLLFEGTQDPSTDGPLPLKSPAALGEYHDRFVLTDAGWKIRERLAKAIFRTMEG